MLIEDLHPGVVAIRARPAAGRLQRRHAVPGTVRVLPSLSNLTLVSFRRTPGCVGLRHFDFRDQIDPVGSLGSHARHALFSVIGVSDGAH
jgi:hypothetical protein